jgi:hypothetical protein
LVTFACQRGAIFHQEDLTHQTTTGDWITKRVTLDFFEKQVTSKTDFTSALITSLSHGIWSRKSHKESYPRLLRKQGTSIHFGLTTSMSHGESYPRLFAKTGHSQLNSLRPPGHTSHGRSYPRLFTKTGHFQTNLLQPKQ